MIWHYAASIYNTNYTQAIIAEHMYDTNYTRTITAEHKAEAHTGSVCSAVRDLYSPRALNKDIKDMMTQHNASQDRILVMGGHGGPLYDTISELLEMGWGPESIYSICKIQNCHLTTPGVTSKAAKGYGRQEWAGKKIGGADQKLIASAEKVNRAIHGNGGKNNDWGWSRGGKEKTLREFMREIRSADDWDGGRIQQSFDAIIGDSLTDFTAVICVFPAMWCLPFMHDRHAPLKVILRLSHRVTNKVAGNDDHSKMLHYMLQRMGKNPSRFMVAAENAFDVAATRVFATGCNLHTAVASCDVRMASPSLQILYWPAYFRYVREWQQAGDLGGGGGGGKFIIEVGMGYRQVTLDRWTEFVEKLNRSKADHEWQYEVGKIKFSNLSSAALAVISPYSTHSCKVNEMYARSVPMLCPSMDLLVSMGSRPSDVQPHIGMSNAVLTTIEPTPKCHPNSSASPLLQWTAWSDAFTHPFIFYFDSWETLPARIDELFADPQLLPNTRKLMRSYWDTSMSQTRPHVKDKLGQLFHQ